MKAPTERVRRARIERKGLLGGYKVPPLSANNEGGGQ